MKPNEAKAVITIRLHISFWDALKLRLAGGKVFEKYLRERFYQALTQKEVSNESSQSKSIVP